MKRKKLLFNLSLFELVAYSILLLLGLWGLVYAALGFACEFVNYKTDLYKANKVIHSYFGLNFLWWGLIIMGIAVVLAVILLCIFAKQSDRDFEKAQRRAARLKKSVTPQPSEVVDAEVAPVEEKK